MAASQNVQNFQNIDELEVLLLSIAKQSPTYQKIALYIEKHYLEIIFMTANELAEAMGVSQGSVSRFFMMLGYRGYNEFLRNLQQVVSKQLTGPQRLGYTRSSADARKSSDSAVRRVLDSEIANLDGLEAALQGPAYEAMVAAVASPKQLILLSARMSATLLPYAAYLLSKMREDVYTFEPGMAKWNTLELVPPESANIIAIAFPRYPNALIEKCRQLKRLGLPITALTDSTLSPIVACADHAVCVPVTTASIFDVYSAPLTFLNLMLRDAAARMPGLAERMERLEDIERRDKIYFQS